MPRSRTIDAEHGEDVRSPTFPPLDRADLGGYEDPPSPRWNNRIEDMDRLADGIDGLNRTIGRFVAWGTIVMGVLQFTMVITRYVFGVGSVWIQESITYVFASLFMLGSASALLTDGHVRVDIWYREATPRGRAWVDLVGTFVFLWPVTGLILYEAYPYVVRAFAYREGSRETAGIPFLYLLKAEILLFAALLALQGLSQVIRATGVLTGRVAVDPDAPVKIHHGPGH